MATSKDNSLGYRTHVIGTAKPVLESTRIVLYNKYQFASNSDYSRISVYNIDSDMRNSRNPPIEEFYRDS